MKKILAGTAAILLFLSGCSEKDPVEVKVPNPGNSEATLAFTSPVEQHAGKEQSTVTFNFSSSQKTFHVTTNRPWCRAEVKDDNKLVITVDANAHKNVRIAQITIVAGIYDNVTAPLTVRVVQAAGDITIPQVGEPYGTGIVYWVGEEPDTAGFRVMSLRKLYGIDAQWSSSLNVTGMTDYSYGMNNVAKITDMKSFPAFDFCHSLPQNKGQGWYLPARNEFPDIMKLYNGGTLPTAGAPGATDIAKRAQFESLLASLGGDPFNGPNPPANGQSYWTSTESGEETAIYVRVWNYSITSGVKSGSARGARCIQYFDLR